MGRSSFTSSCCVSSSNVGDLKGPLLHVIPPEAVLETSRIPRQRWFELQELRCIPVGSCPRATPAGMRGWQGRDRAVWCCHLSAGGQQGFPRGSTMAELMSAIGGIAPSGCLCAQPGAKICSITEKRSCVMGTALRGGVPASE